MLSQHLAAERRALAISPAETSVPVAVSIAHLSKTYPVPLARLKKFFRRKFTAPVEALCDVSFEIREGEQVSGAFVYVQSGRLGGIEIYGGSGDAPKRLPSPEQLRPFGGPAAA